MKRCDDRVSDWSLYLVRLANGRLYTGISLDVDRRFEEHCAGAPKGAKALRGQGPLTLVFRETVGDRSRALRLELRVKALSRAEKERLIRGERCLSDLLPGSVAGPSRED